MTLDAEPRQVIAIGGAIAHYRIVTKLDQLEHEERLALRLLEPVDGGNVGMVEGGEDLRLPPEAREALGIPGHLGR